jgi:hypothetical protein
MTLAELKENWKDEPSYHQHIHELFIKHVNEDTLLNKHRTWVETNIWGFGERSFHWFWLLLINEMPNEFSFCEVGVFRGQSISLVALIAMYQDKISHVYGVSPLDSSDGHYESDYRTDIKRIHDEFELPESYTIYHGSSTDKDIIKQATQTAPYDIVYIDGCHLYDYVVSDLNNYAPMVKAGGYLVVDDACCDMDMPFGFFQGIVSVTNAVLEWENEQFEFQFNVVHLRVYKRK